MSAAMPIELEEWQARLELHFATLRDSRRARGIAEPLFGLEHGLTQAEVQELERAVRAHIAHRRPSQNHWLAWIVYSAELGYQWELYTSLPKIALARERLARRKERLDYL